MNQNKHYFFCGIGGSGMLPLAMILKGRREEVEGSDRSLDQGRTPEKFDFLRSQGIKLYPQDGSGMTSPRQILVTSTAVEATIPDVKAAQDLGAKHMTRAQLLAELFNSATTSIGVAGTSGKSTTTGMIGWILHCAGKEPTIMNGAILKNFATSDAPFASAVAGDPSLFVSEVDESDGSIANYTPTIAVLNNIAFDHKPLDELRQLFRDYIGKAKTAILNLDNEETATLATTVPKDKLVTYALANPQADLRADNITPAPGGISFDVIEPASSSRAAIDLKMPGEHNVANGLAALAAARACGIELAEAAKALSTFTGIKRRLELVGQANNITVIDDFAHNPDKIAATLATLHAFPGRLLIMFQPHGFGPLRLMKDQFIECFVGGLKDQDVLIMPEPVYYGGTVERTVSSGDIASGIVEKGRQALAFEDREACGKEILTLAKPGDRLIIMGARDDTLSEFAEELLDRLK
jgi:UDP-N-acetylmuramate--alanine ligase